MASDRMYNVGSLEDTTGRTQLISPPPEETLSLRRTSGANHGGSASKRKRNMPQPAEPSTEPPQPPEATPNPKPRKQSKHRPVLFSESPTRPSHRSPAPNPTTPSKANRVPHTENPDADYLPPLPSSTTRRATMSARARRTTPIPAYEPPSDVFTPPRVVVLTPTISKSSKRKSNTKPKPKRPAESLKVVIKKEPPQIDLTLPMPPPSPTDDPLLLSGPIEPPTSTPARPRRQLKEVGVSTQVYEPLPPSSSPPDEDEPGVPRFEWTQQPEPEASTDFSMDVDATVEPGVQPVALFDFNLPGSSDVGGGWTDSDDDDDNNLPARVEEEGVGEGEYTGRFRTLRVRTKQDPPSSATRERMEEWGRPITPFPRKKIERLDLLKEVDGEDEANQDVEMDEEEPEHEDEEEEREVREMSVPLGDEEDQEQSVELEQEPPAENPKPHFDFDESFDVQDASELTADTSIDVDQPITQNDAPDLLEDAAALPLHDQDDQEDINHDAEPSLEYESEADSDENDAEEREVREMSFAEDDEVIDQPTAATSAHRSAASTPVPIVLNNAHARPVAVPFPSSQPAEEEANTVAKATKPAVEEEERETDPYQEEIETEETHATRVADTVDDDDASDSDSDVDYGMVKISSADPRAAARAAAILKQHDYDCFTKITMKQKQRKRHSLASSRGVAEGGITKARSGEKRRRTTLGASVIGDRVYMPGSPVVTLPELLKEAEAEVVAESPRLKPKTPAGVAMARSLFETPVRGRGMVAAPKVVLGKRAWTKEEWKVLDACFTDERLEVGCVGGQGMAPVDLVRPENVVARFIEVLGGEDVVETFGDAWNRDNLLQRVKALQNKQRSGNVAPPTTPYTPSPSALNTFAHSRRVPSMEVPDFTPLGRRAVPPARAQRPIFPPPVLENAPFANLPPQKEPARPTRKLPMSLLAPRYSHLLEEAVAVSQLSTAVADSSVADAKDNESNNDASTATKDEAPSPEDDEATEPSVPPTPSPPPPSATIGHRVKGFLFSYLPTLSKTAPPGPKKSGHQLPRRPGLPLPPLDVLEKPRGPIATPVRAPAPKPRHPKELVHLQPAPPPPKPTMIPRAKKPQRLVELHPVTPPAPASVMVPRPRRSSGGSVKDLVKSFEELDSRRGSAAAEAGRAELKRVRSIGEWRKTTGAGAGAGKPSWRP